MRVSDVLARQCNDRPRLYVISMKYLLSVRDSSFSSCVRWGCWCARDYRANDVCSLSTSRCVCVLVAGAEPIVDPLCESRRYLSVSTTIERVTRNRVSLSRRRFRFWRSKSVSRSSDMQWQGRPGLGHVGMGRCCAAGRLSPVMASFWMPLPLDAPAGAVPEHVLLTADDILPYI